MDTLQTIKLAMVSTNLDITGISTVIINYCQILKRSGLATAIYRYEIYVIAGSRVAESNRRILESMDVKVIELSPRKTKPAAFYASLIKVMAKERFDIVHVHGNSATITPELFIAWFLDTKIRIAHSHSTTCSRMKAHKLLFPLFKRLYTHSLACSTEAGRWMFRNNNFLVMPNSFDTRRFIFDEETRRKMRHRLGIENRFLIGHVGNFCEWKNHEFLLEIFAEVSSHNKFIDPVLLLVGNGPDVERTKNLIIRHPAKENIILYGETDCIEELYAAMDVFVLPSKHEGLGMVLLEAQINGLPCIVSDVVPREVCIGDNVSFLSLENSSEQWAESILSVGLDSGKRKDFYRQNWDRIKVFDNESNIEGLKKLYEESKTS